MSDFDCGKMIKRIGDLAIEKKQLQERINEIESIQDELMRRVFREEHEKELLQGGETK